MLLMLLPPQPPFKQHLSLVIVNAFPSTDGRGKSIVVALEMVVHPHRHCRSDDVEGKNCVPRMENFFLTESALSRESRTWGNTSATESGQGARLLSNNFSVRQIAVQALGRSFGR
jgi:hypothetical protein